MMVGRVVVGVLDLNILEERTVGAKNVIASGSKCLPLLVLPPCGFVPVLVALYEMECQVLKAIGSNEVGHLLIAPDGRVGQVGIKITQKERGDW